MQSFELGTMRIWPFGPQSPPRTFLMEQMTSASPPATGIFLSLSRLGKTICRLSGDQKIGSAALLVPAIGLATVDSRFLSQTRPSPLESNAPNASMRPSGGSLGPPPPPGRAPP